MPPEKTLLIPSRADAITDAVNKVFSSTLSSGQLKKMRPDIKAAVVSSVEDIDIVEREDFLKLHTLRPAAEWHEDKGPSLWWILPIAEPPYCGTPGDSDWPGYHTHWSPLPKCEMLVASDGTETQGQ